jgi:AcrR family transcriptional regulator
MPHELNDFDATRERLIDVVIALIEERGSSAISMAEIAGRSGMAVAGLQRYFDSREAMIELVAERWFRPMVEIMEDVVAGDLPPRRKMYEFFVRRFVRLKAEWTRDPVVFAIYCEVGRENFEEVRSYVDLGDHYLSGIIGEAMADGHFAGLEVDEALSLVNQMVATYCNIGAMEGIMPRLSEDKLARIIDAIFDGLSGQDRGARGVAGLRAA